MCLDVISGSGSLDVKGPAEDLKSIKAIGELNCILLQDVKEKNFGTGGLWDSQWQPSHAPGRHQLSDTRS